MSTHFFHEVCSNILLSDKASDIDNTFRIILSKLTEPTVEKLSTKKASNKSIQIPIVAR